MNQTKSGNIIDVNQADFEREVIQRSHAIPVVVDFWAPWCGPCRMLGPVLERLASEPGSNFILAKVNSDHNPQLSMQFGVRGIPAVKGFRNGQVVDEFVGAQPEPMVRQFVQRLTANFRPQTQTAKPSPPVGNDPVARLDRAKQLLRQGNGCEAQVQLEGLPASDQASSAEKLLPLARFLCQLSRGNADVPAEAEGAYRQVGDAIRRREYATAMYNLLAIQRQEQQQNKGQARRIMLALFELLGDGDPLTQAYRQQMASVV